MTEIIPGINSDNPHAVFSAAQVFCEHQHSPWLNNPIVSGPGPDNKVHTWPLNPQYYATPLTAAIVKPMVGGVAIVQVNPFASNQRYSSTAVYQMIQLPSGGLINAGLVAVFFTHGFNLEMIAMMIQEEIANVNAGH